MHVGRSECVGERVCFGVGWVRLEVSDGGVTNLQMR